MEQKRNKSLVTVGINSRHKNIAAMTTKGSASTAAVILDQASNSIRNAHNTISGEGLFSNSNYDSATSRAIKTLQNRKLTKQRNQHQKNFQTIEHTSTQFGKSSGVENNYIDSTTGGNNTEQPLSERTRKKITFKPQQSTQEISSQSGSIVQEESFEGLSTYDQNNHFGSLESLSAGGMTVTLDPETLRFKGLRPQTTDSYISTINNRFLMSLNSSNMDNHRKEVLQRNNMNESLINKDFNQQRPATSNPRKENFWKQLNEFKQSVIEMNSRFGEKIDNDFASIKQKQLQNCSNCKKPCSKPIIKVARNQQAMGGGGNKMFPSSCLACYRPIITLDKQNFMSPAAHKSGHVSKLKGTVEPTTANNNESGQQDGLNIQLNKSHTKESDTESSDTVSELFSPQNQKQGGITPPEVVTKGKILEKKERGSREQLTAPAAPMFIKPSFKKSHFNVFDVAKDKTPEPQKRVSIQKEVLFQTRHVTSKELVEYGQTFSENQNLSFNMMKMKKDKSSLNNQRLSLHKNQDSMFLDTENHLKLIKTKTRDYSNFRNFNQVAQKLRALVRGRLIDFVTNMKQTNKWKRYLTNVLVKMKQDYQNQSKHVLLDTYERKFNYKMDHYKIRFIRACIAYLDFSERCFHDNDKVECLLGLREIIRMASIVPDHKVVIAVYEHQGILNKNTGNYKGALRSFQKMRDAAEDAEDRINEMKAYLNIGQVFQLCKEYQMAIVAFKRLIQVAWHEDNQHYEMIAFDHIGLQYFYQGDIKKAEYYHDRAVRGKTEPMHSKVRELAKVQYIRKISERDQIFSADRQTSNNDAYQQLNSAPQISNSKFQKNNQLKYCRVEDRVNDTVKMIIHFARNNSKNDHVLTALKEAVNGDQQTTFTNQTTFQKDPKIGGATTRFKSINMRAEQKLTVARKTGSATSGRKTMGIVSRGATARQLLKNQTKSSNKNNDDKFLLAASENDQKEAKELKRLFAAEDMVFERTESQIQRMGTPVNDMNTADLPSPVANRGKKDNSNAHNQSQSGSDTESNDSHDAAKDNQSKKNKNKNNNNQNQIVTENKATNLYDKFKKNNLKGSGEKKRRNFVRDPKAINYLEEFQNELELREQKHKKLLQTMRDGTVGKIDMKVILNKARINANKKPHYQITLSHLSPIRQQKDNQETLKLEVLTSFSRLRDLFETELENVILIHQQDGCDGYNYVSISQLQKQEEMLKTMEADLKRKSTKKYTKSATRTGISPYRAANNANNQTHLSL